MKTFLRTYEINKYLGNKFGGSHNARAIEEYFRLVYNIYRGIDNIANVVL